MHARFADALIGFSIDFGPGCFLCSGLLFEDDIFYESEAMMKKPSQPNPHGYPIQTRFAVAAPVESLAEIRQERLRLEQELQTISADVDARLAALAEGFAPEAAPAGSPLPTVTLSEAA